MLLKNIYSNPVDNQKAVNAPYRIRRLRLYICDNGPVMSLIGHYFLRKFTQFAIFSVKFGINFHIFRIWMIFFCKT